MLSNYSTVRLLSDDYASKGASCGDFGYIIEVYPATASFLRGAYEVEFSRADGSTYALVAASPEDLELADLPSTQYILGV